jgi:hypothetical protein
MGPGTHIRGKILAGTQPLNKLDEIALVHDINYVYAGSDPRLIQLADDAAMRVNQGNLLGFVMDAGLTIRKYLKLKENGVDYPRYYAHMLKQKAIDRGLINDPDVMNSFIF